jgi:calcium-dependent protein kinase
MGQCQLIRQSLDVDQIVVGRERRHSKANFQGCHFQGKTSRPLQCQYGPGNIRLGTLVSPKTRRFADEYSLLATTVGSGSSGDVQLARCLQGDGLVAVKILDKTGLTKKQQRALIREVDILLGMDHSNIIRLLQVFDEHDKIYLVMEYCSGGTLEEKLEKKDRFGEREAALVMHQVLSAVSYCHSRPSGKVIHRDLKLANFVYNQKGEDAMLKLLDFGLSRVLAPGGSINSAAGTLEFMAPEVLREEQHGEACDLWSVGIMAYTLVSGKLPFDGADAEIESAILRGDWHMNDDVWAGVSASAKAFVTSLLCSDPRGRPNADAALSLPWMAEVTAQSKLDATPPLTMDVLHRLEQFANENAMRRAAAAIAVYSQVELQGDDVDAAEKQFHSVDANGHGTITQEELTKVLQLELGIGPDRCRWIFEQMDLNGDKEIQRSEFLAAVVGVRLLRSNKEVGKAFKHFDSSQDGKIHPGELAGMLGDTFCGRPTKHIFSELDSNGDHVVDFEEFSSMVNTSNPKLLNDM